MVYKSKNSKNSKRKEITIYVVTKEYNEKQIGKYAFEGKDKLWLQKSHYYDVDFGAVFYRGHVNAADQAVKICRINVNASARNIREMALNNDTSAYDSYEQTVKKQLTEVDSQLEILKKTKVLPDEEYNEYASALSDWGNIGYSIIEEIKNGEKEKAIDEIFNSCTPALNKLVEIAIRLDEITDEVSEQSARTTIIFAVAGIVCIIICLVYACTLAKVTSKKVLETILDPLRAVEDAAKELTEGNLHSKLEYNSDD